MKYYLCITPFFPSADNFRGSYVYDQVKAIEHESDYKVIVVKPAPFWITEDDYEFEGVTVLRPRSYTLPSNLWPNSLSDELTYRAILRKLKKEGVKMADVTICHCHVAAMASTAVCFKRDFPHIKTIVQHHGFDVMSTTDGKLAKYARHKRRCERYGADICNKVDINVGVSSLTLKYVEQTPGVALKRKMVLYNGVDLNKFYPAPKSRRSSDESFVIGCIANFWELKDQMTLIRAAELLVQEGYKIKVRFVGTGYTRPDCELYIENRGLKQFFEFSDSINHTRLNDFYNGLNLFVLPSYWEAFGCVYTEAYACGIPFIGVKGQGIAELFAKEDQDRWLISPHDYAGLAKLIKRNIECPSEMPELRAPVDINQLIGEFLSAI